MKNLLFIFFIGLVGIAVSSSAKANPSSLDNTIYVGIEAQYKDYGLGAEEGAESFFEGKTIAPAIFAGYNLPQGFAIELGYSQSSSKESVTGDFDGLTSFNSDIKIQAINLDLIKNFEVMDRLNIFGLVGLDYAKIEIDESGMDIGSPISFKTSENNLGYSIGAGLGYKVIDNVTLRTKVKYTKLGAKTNSSFALKEIDDSLTLGIGVLYQF